MLFNFLLPLTIHKSITPFSTYIINLYFGSPFVWNLPISVEIELLSENTLHVCYSNYYTSSSLFSLERFYEISLMTVFVMYFSIFPTMYVLKLWIFYVGNRSFQFLHSLVQKALLPADPALRSHFPNPIHSPPSPQTTQISFTVGILWW